MTNETPTPNFRYPHPKPFTNVRDGFAIMEFIDGMNLFFVGAHIPPADQIHTTLAFAGAKVIAWWRLHSPQYVDPLSFPQFAELLRKEYSPANFKDHLIYLVMSMAMKGKFTYDNASDYITLARQYHLLLTGYYPITQHPAMEDMLRTAFLHGLPPLLRQMVEVTMTHRTLSLNDLFAMTERHAETLTNNSTNSNSLITAGVTANTISDPNAMEVDSIQLQINNLNRQLSNMNRTFNNNSNNNNNNRNNNNNNSFRNNNNNNGNPPPLTPEERIWCARNNACRRCRQIGHYGVDCPIYGDNNNRSSNNNGRQGRWVFQVTVGDSPESGKASDDQA